VDIVVKFIVIRENENLSQKDVSTSVYQYTYINICAHCSLYPQFTFTQFLLREDDLTIHMRMILLGKDNPPRWDYPIM